MKDRVRSSPILIICFTVLFTAAALDDWPDPPAVSPHKISVVSRLQSEAHSCICAPYLNSGCFAGSPESRIRWIRFRLVSGPTLPSGWMLLTRYAANLSPPPSKLRKFVN